MRMQDKIDDEGIVRMKTRAFMCSLIEKRNEKKHVPKLYYYFVLHFVHIFLASLDLNANILVLLGQESKLSC